MLCATTFGMVFQICIKKLFEEPCAFFLSYDEMQKIGELFRHPY